MTKAVIAGMLAAAAVWCVASAEARSSTTGPQGTWVRTVTKADFARTSTFRHEGPGQTLPPSGVYHLTFSAHTFRAVDPGKFPVAQTYSLLSGGRLSVGAYVNPAKGAFCGPEISQTASYAWSVTGRTLTLKAKADGCADRNSILVGRWTRIAG